MHKILIIGSGGLAREVTDWVRLTHDIVGYATPCSKEHQAFSLVGSHFDGHVTPDIVGTDLALIAIGTPAVRKRMAVELKQAGFSFPTMVHPSSVVSTKAKMGEGVVVASQCAVSPDVTIGDFSFINFCVGIGHDAIVGDFVQINPGAQVGGGATVEDDVIIGSGATILHGAKLRRAAVIASGAVVFSRAPAAATMMGNPAKRMRMFEE